MAEKQKIKKSKTQTNRTLARCHLERRKRLSIVFEAEPDIKEGGIEYNAEISGENLNKLLFTYNICINCDGIVSVLTIPVGERLAAPVLR